MRSFVVLLLVLAALAGAWFLSTLGTRATRVQAVEGSAPSGATPTRAPAELEPVAEAELETPPPLAPKPAPEKPRKKREPEPKAETPKQPASPGLPRTGPTGADETLLQQTYAGQTLQDLNRASRQVYSEHRAAVQRLMEERYANGFYESYPYEYDVDGNRLEASDVIPQPPAGDLRIRQVFEDSAVNEWRLVELPENEYPALYERYREWKWLEAEIKAREQADHE